MIKATRKEEAIRLRVEQRMSFKEIATATGVSKASLSLWLKGHPLTEEELAKRKADKDTSQVGKTLRVKKSKEELEGLRPKFKLMGLPPKRIGEISEAVVVAELIKRGFEVLRPVGDSLRYDLAIDYEGRIYRVQVKTGRTDGDTVTFSACSTDGYRSMMGADNAYKTYEGQIEWFASYVPEVDQVFMFPIQEATKFSITLRITDSLTTPNCKMAKDYILNEDWRPDKKRHDPG